MSARIPRPLTGALPLLLAACSITALAGCGGGQTATAAPTARGRDHAAVSLVITYAPQPGAASRRWTLRCQPAGGTYPHPTLACRALRQAKNPIASNSLRKCPAPAADRPAIAVKGTWFGHPVNATFLAGCGLPRWAEAGKRFN